MVRVAVLGCGLLGVKIAGEFAYHGNRVKCYDNNLQSLNSVYTRYQSDKAQLYSDQVIESPNFTGQVLCLSRLEETVNDAQLIIECVVEDFDVKSVLLEKVSNICPLDSIIISNTLRLDVAKLAEKVKNKERFIGLRFLYPVYYISEVEITPHKDTSNQVIEKLRKLLGQMGKTLFFRSGSDPLILTEEKRELRKLQRIEELRNSNGLPPIMTIRQESNVPELSKNNNSHTDLTRLFLRRATTGGVGGMPDFYSIQSNTDFFYSNAALFNNFNNGNYMISNNAKENNNNSSNKKSKSKNENKNKIQLEEFNDNAGGQDNDCAICMDSSRNSVLRPCNHMITCYDCSILLLNRQDSCPVCREKIDEVIRIFMS